MRPRPGTCGWMTVSHDTYVSRTLALVKFPTTGDDPRQRYPELALGPELLAEE